MAPETDRDQAYSWPSKRDEELQTRLQAAVNSYKEWAEAWDHAAAGQRKIYHVLEEVLQKLESKDFPGRNGRPQQSPPGSSPSSALSELQAQVYAAVDGYVSARGPAFTLGLSAREAF